MSCEHCVAFAGNAVQIWAAILRILGTSVRTSTSRNAKSHFRAPPPKMCPRIGGPTAPGGAAGDARGLAGDWCAFCGAPGLLYTGNRSVIQQVVSGKPTLGGRRHRLTAEGHATSLGDAQSCAVPEPHWASGCAPNMILGGRRAQACTESNYNSLQGRGFLLRTAAALAGGGPARVVRRVSRVRTVC